MENSFDDRSLPLRIRDVKNAWRACDGVSDTREKEKTSRNDAICQPQSVATIWLEKEEAAYWLFACILRKINVGTATLSQC